MSVIPLRPTRPPFDAHDEVRTALRSLNTAIARCEVTDAPSGLRALLITARTGLEGAVKLLALLGEWRAA